MSERLPRALTLKRYQVFVLGLFLILTLASVIQPKLIYGDDYSDANVAIAGENFYNYGLSKSVGVPYCYFRGPYENCIQTGSVCADTHYPAFPYWVNYALRKIGVDHLSGFRLFSLGLSLIFALLLPQFFLLILNNEKVAVLSSGVYLVSPAFLNNSDSLHQHPWMSLCWLGFALSWIVFLRTEKKKFFIFSYLIFLVSVWTSFEQFLFIPIFAVGSALIERKFKWAFWFLAVLSSVPFGTLIVRIYQQSFLFHSWQGSLHDMIFAAQYRSGITWLEFLNQFQKRLIDLISPLILGFILSFSLIRNSFSLSMKKWLILLFFSGFAWWLAMKQHFYVHIHTNSQMMPFYSLALGLLIYFLIEQRKKIIFLFVCLAIGLKFLGTDQWNRWLPLNRHLYERMHNLTVSLNELEKLKLNFRSEEMIYIELAAHNLAFHATEGTYNNFTYALPEEICSPSAGWGIIRNEAFSAGIEKQCLEKGHLLQKTAALVFIKYK